MTERLPAGNLIAPLAPPFLRALELELDPSANSLDVTLAAPALPGDSALTATTPLAEHERVDRAHRHRRSESRRRNVRALRLTDLIVPSNSRTADCEAFAF